MPDQRALSTAETPGYPASDIFAKCYEYTYMDEARAGGYYLVFRTMESAQSPEVIYQGKPTVMIGSNNYLGLTVHPRVMAASHAAIDQYGTGCAGSRWLNGNMVVHEELEVKLADFVRQDRAVVYATGYQANLGAIGCLAGRNDLIIIDKLDHASILDGCKMSGGQMVRFKHNDMDDLKRLLEREADRPKMIIVDGVFSMEGDLADLPAIVDLAKRHNARLFVDDAHGLGVMGPTGRGTCEHFGIEDQVDLIMGTFSKSLAGIGGFIAGEEKVIDYIKHQSRSLMFSAALPPVLAAAAKTAVEVIETEPELRANLWANTKYFKDGLDKLGFDTGDSVTPVIPVVLGGLPEVVGMVNGLAQEGVFANPVLPPAVPPGRGLIRTSLMATHTREHLDRALAAFEKVGRAMGFID